MSTITMAPTADEKDELLLSCRYGDLQDVQEFVKLHGKGPLADVRDENGNCVLHMVSGNGHIDILDYLLHAVPSSLLSTTNRSGSTPLHWAALNSHIEVMKKLVEFPGGPGRDLIDAKNLAGLSPLAEAELAGWEEGARWLVEVMNLEADEGTATGDGEKAGEETLDGRDIEVQIEDADGKMAKMTISANGSRSTLTTS